MPAPNLPQQYAAQYAKANVLPQHLAAVDRAARYIRLNCARYASVAGRFPSLPAYVVGILHQMECSGRFDQHLHNGDPLTARTKQVPAGRPKTGSPPFTWEQSAIDAIICDGLDVWKDWSIGGTLVALERYNGLGYRKRGLPSPYLWSFTDQARPGKYTADGRFDPKAISQQPGAAALMKLLGIM